MALSPLFFFKNSARVRPWMARTAAMPLRDLVRPSHGQCYLVRPEERNPDPLPRRLVVRPSNGRILSSVRPRGY